jgi:hypothetical protein
LAALIYYHAGALALDTYNEACAIGDRFVDSFQDPPSTLTWALLILAMPVLFARSGLLIKTNAVFSLVTLLCAAHLFISTKTLPDECVTTSGTYEDHASGLGEFVLFVLLVILLSYVFAAIDLLTWGVRLLVAGTTLRSG